MNIALDISPLKNGNFLQHRVRGTGFYTENLKEALFHYFPENTYILTSRGEKITASVDIIHYPYFEPFFLTLPVLKKFPSVVTVHDLTPFVFPRNFPAGIKGNIRWLIQRFSLKNMNAVITDSQSSKEDIIRFTGISEKKVHVISLAAGNAYKKITVNQEERDLLIKKYNLPERFILYVGDITWNKNIPRLIEAIKKTKLPSVFVGNALVEKNFDKLNPWNQDRVKVQKLLEADETIHVVGFIPTEDLVALYNIAVVFVMPSLYEGFGLPILEAMNCGCPVVTTKEGSLKEVAGEAAYFVNAYSVDDIATGIHKVFTDKKLQEKLSERGLSQAHKFSWKNTAEKTLQVYESVH